MTFKKFKYIYFLFFVICIQKIYSQSIIIGGKYGFYSPSIIQKIIDPEIKLFVYEPKLFNTGIIVEYPLKGEHTSISSGIFFTNFIASYITIPTDIKLHFGKNLRVNIVFGFYNSFLTSKQDNYNFFDWGLNPGLGIGYCIKDKFEIFIDYQKYFGIKSAYLVSSPSHFGTTSYTGETNNFGFYNFGILYKIPIKKNENNSRISLFRRIFSHK